MQSESHAENPSLGEQAALTSIVNQTEQLKLSPETAVEELQPAKRVKSDHGLGDVEEEEKVNEKGSIAEPEMTEVLNVDPTNPMLQKLVVTALDVVSSVPAKTFASTFLSSASLKKASEARNATSYVNSLLRLCEVEGQNLAITSTEYKFANATTVKLFDVKCRARFEDELVDKICRNWIVRDGAKFGKVCPLRRGICIGLINDLHLVLAVGNCKFFYGDEGEILSTLGPDNAGTIVLSEKANGEYTVLSSTIASDGMRWLTVGSKNVRLCLPFVENNSQFTKDVFESLVFKFTKQNSTKEEGHRYMYLGEMLDLWLRGLTSEDSKAGMMKELDRGTTLVGEQVGVHAHIFTGYDHPHIRLFGSLPFQSLTTEMACSLNQLKIRLFGSESVPGGKHLQVVNLDPYTMPHQIKELKDGLERVASGSMEVYGEGVVVYVYNDREECLNLYKFKCQEYAFDRRLRTVLSRPAGELSRSGLSRLRLKDESARVATEMTKAYQNQFTKMNSQRAEERVAAVPAMFAFLDRHQVTLYCSDFSEHFTTFVEATLARKLEYSQLADKLFLGVDDVLQTAFGSFLAKFEEVQVPVRTVTDMAQEIVAKWKQHGGRDKFPCIGIASGPGSGKTAILKEVHRLLEEAEPGSSKICDRDAYVIADPAAKGDAIHRLWVDDIASSTKKENKVCLVGNTFTGAFADKLETQAKTKLLLFALKEHTVPVAQRRLVPNPSMKRGVLNWTPEEMGKARACLFDLVCLRRLSQRIETHADGSTLTMGLGCKTVLDKFFASQPEEQMMKRRLKDKTAVLIGATDEMIEFSNLDQLVDVARSLCQLKNTVANPPVPSLSTGNKELDDPGYVPRVPRGNFLKMKLPYYRKSSARPKVKYAALLPTVNTAKTCFALADVDVIRADCHLTLAYQPSDKDVVDMLKKYQEKEEEGMEVLLTKKVTVTMANKLVTHKLQFMVVEPKPLEDKALLPPSPHVTLGSTNADLLPYVTSGKVLASLEESNQLLTETTETEMTVDGVKYRVTIESLESPIAYLGIPHFVCTPK